MVKMAWSVPAREDQVQCTNERIGHVVGPARHQAVVAAAAAVGLIACGPAIAADVHCYTMGVAGMIVPDLFNKNKLGMTAERVELGGEFLDEPGTCCVEITTNTGLLMKYKFRYDGATG